MLWSHHSDASIAAGWVLCCRGGGKHKQNGDDERRRWSVITGIAGLRAGRLTADDMVEGV